jgi:transcriptional regulator with XRE-family HTH domain
MAVQTARKLVPADSLANRLILIRRELNLSQRDAAQRCGVGFGSWQSWENGSAPRNALRDLVWVAERLDVDRDWLMFGGPLRPDDGLELPRVDSNHQPAGLENDPRPFGAAEKLAMRKLLPQRLTSVPRSVTCS